MRITRRPLFYWILRRHRFLQFLLLLVILAGLFFRVFPLEMQKRIINQAIHLKDEQLLFLYCGLYIGAVILAGVFKYVINVMQTIIGQKILAEMRTELYRHILQLPLQFYHTMQPGTVISTMTAELNAIGFFLGGALAIPVTSVLTLVTFLGFMFSLSPLLALLSIAIYPFELVVIPLLQKHYNRLNTERIKTSRAMGNGVNEAISGIHEVHANAAYRLEEERMTSFIDTLYGLLKKLFIVKYGIKFAHNMIQSFGPAILFLVGGYLAIHGEFTLGALVAFLSAYQKIYDPWKEMLGYYQSLQDALVRYQQIMEIFDVAPAHPLLPEGREPYRLTGDIEFKDVTLTVGDKVKILDRITMRVRANEQIALVGASGAGKSTLALLMAQIYDADQGSILIGGKEISALSKTDISRNVNMIAQHPFIFTGTIRDNLLYAVQAGLDGGDPLPDKNRLFEVVRDVGLKEDVLRFALNMVIARDRVTPIKAKLAQIRRTIPGEPDDNAVSRRPSEYRFQRSLIDNLMSDSTRQQSQNAARLHDIAVQAVSSAGLTDELLDIGLDFEVGSQGDRLSGGQQQKVALARAFLKDSPILIMDEATAGLDNTSQARIQNLLETKYRGNTTIISVIHRLDLAPSYDRIFVLKGGAIIENGAYDELMRNKGAFYDLTQNQ